MSEAVVAISIFCWLALAGWSYRHTSEGMPKDLVMVVFAFCILLAPFIAGAVIANKSYETDE